MSASSGWCAGVDDFSLSGRRSLLTLAGQDDSCVGKPCGDGRRARIVRLYPPSAEGGERWEIETDPRHVETLVSEMGLNNKSKAVSTPGVGMSDEDDGKELDAENRACCRSWTMRASYLSQDRCELQFAVKELARRMQQPNMQALKRLVRFLKGSPRCLVVYNRQPEQPFVDVFSDSDWAGCTKTRRSTSSSYVMLGGHLLVSSATTQNVVATR